MPSKPAAQKTRKEILTATRQNKPVKYPIRIRGRTLCTLRLTPNQRDDIVGAAVAVSAVTVFVALALTFMATARTIEVQRV